MNTWTHQQSTRAALSREQYGDLGASFFIFFFRDGASSHFGFSRLPLCVRGSERRVVCVRACVGGPLWPFSPFVGREVVTWIVDREAC